MILFSPGFSGSQLTSGVVWNTTAVSSLVASGSIKSTVPHAVFSTRLTFIILEEIGMMEGSEGAKGAHVSGFGLSPPSPRMHFDRFLGHLLAIDELL